MRCETRGPSGPARRWATGCTRIRPPPPWPAWTTRASRGAGSPRARRRPWGKRGAGRAGGARGDGTRAHPPPAAVAGLDYEDLTRRRFSRRKAEYLVDTARLLLDGELPLPGAGGELATRAAERLLAVRGLGPWSVQYLLMRGGGFADCVPVGDAGLTAALQRFFALPARPGPEETERLMEPFAPNRSLATYHLWMSLGEPL